MMVASGVTGPVDISVGKAVADGSGIRVDADADSCEKQEEASTLLWVRRKSPIKRLMELSPLWV